MATRYRVDLFGKSGCVKCKILRQRFDKLLVKDEWQDVELKYFDIETEEGIINFCDAECINPQRIPAVLVKERDPETGDFVPVPNKTPGKKDEVIGNSHLHQYVGLQTDYSEKGQGVISPKMVVSMLIEATG